MESHVWDSATPQQAAGYSMNKLSACWCYISLSIVQDLVPALHNCSELRVHARSFMNVLTPEGVTLNTQFSTQLLAKQFALWRNTCRRLCHQRFVRRVFAFGMRSLAARLALLRSSKTDAGSYSRPSCRASAASGGTSCPRKALARMDCCSLSTCAFARL